MKIGNVEIDDVYYSGQDLYCDGEVEDEMLEIAKTVPQDQYNRIIMERRKWPIAYHFSHVRTNVVTWLPITKEDKVLEIGAGCGAITGALTNMAGTVECIELSMKRSQINAYRHRDRKNLCIHVGNFNDIEPHIEKKYDYIMLIGVLEYAESYTNTEQPYTDFLKIMKKHLKPEGKIVIAIENKYGLKYWAGCKEDHVSRYFEGLEGYTTTSGVRTFSSDGLEKMIRGAGFENYTFYYPYPDYKFPMQIYSDDYLPKKGDLSNNMQNLDNARLQLFDERKVFDSLIEENKFREYSNSYIVIVEGGKNE